MRSMRSPGPKLFLKKRNSYQTERIPILILGVCWTQSLNSLFCHSAAHFILWRWVGDSVLQHDKVNTEMSLAMRKPLF